MTQGIFEQAVVLFAQKGYQGLSMRHLAAALGMTTGVLYHYFRNKEELYTQMLQYLADRDAQSLHYWIATTQNKAEPLHTLLTFLETRSAYFQQILLLLLDHQRLIANPDLSHEPAFIQVFERPLEIYQETLQTVLALENLQSAQGVLDYLMGCFMRALLYRQAPDFSQLSAWVLALNLSQKGK